MKKFLEFALIWYSQQMAIPFWVVGHVHLSLSTYQDIHEIIASVGLNVLVAVGFIIDYKKNGKQVGLPNCPSYIYHVERLSTTQN